MSDEQQKRDLSQHPIIQSVSQYIGIIAIFIIVVVVIVFIAFFSYESTYETKVQDRRENALLYDDAAQQNILGAKDMPEVEIGKPRNAQGQQMTKEQAMQQQMLQQQAMQQQQMRQQAPGSPPAESIPREKEPSPTPEPTELPENLFVNNSKTLSFEVPRRWTKTESGAQSNDSEYVVRVREEVTEDDLESYVENNPFGRSPGSGWEDTTVSGEDAIMTKPYRYDPGGQPVRTQAIYTYAKDEERILILEVDTTNLDVNDDKLEKYFKEIKDSVKLLDTE
ncbi:MAG: hypothetical protein ACOCXQ_02660 [Patescibacteria group bacterium]